MLSNQKKSAKQNVSCKATMYGRVTLIVKSLHIMSSLNPCMALHISSSIGVSWQFFGFSRQKNVCLSWLQWVHSYLCSALPVILSIYKVVWCKNATKLVYSKILCSISAPSPISKFCAVITYLCEKTTDLGYIGLCECLFTLDEQTSAWCWGSISTNSLCCRTCCEAAGMKSMYTRYKKHMTAWRDVLTR